MKNLKIFITALLFLGVCTMAISQTAEKTLVKSFNLQGTSAVSLELDGPVVVKSWNNKTVRVQMNIALHNRAESFLRGMITAGRYNLKSLVDENALVITQPGMERKVRLKSGVLDERISFIVFAPENVHVEIINEASSAKSLLKVSGSK